MTVTDIAQTITLANGIAMPYFGLGVWSAPSGEETRQAVAAAIRAGYRHIDTAEAYGNEADVGEGIRRSGVPRDRIFVTTKLSPGRGGYDDAKAAFASSLDRMGIGWIDLYLIHWPTLATRRESWRAIEELYRAGKVRAIGVSNYTVAHLTELAGYASILPMCNQVEMSPFLYQQALIAHCRERGIAVSAYSPLTRGVKLGHPVVVKIAAKHGRTPGQVLIRWCLEHGLVVFPKSTHEERIRENAGVFSWCLDSADLAELDRLDEGFRCNPKWNPELQA